MKLTDKNSEIRIYQSVWENTFYAICCLAFAIVGYLIIINPSTKWPTKIFGGLLNMIFFGGASALFFAMASHKRIRRIPFLIIYADRLGIYKQRNGDYHTINYADVKKFRLVKIHSSKMIAVDYKTAPLIHKFDGASDLKQNIMNFNFNEIGAIENIPVHNLTMKGKEICDILNRRLNCWQVRPAE